MTSILNHLKGIECSRVLEMCRCFKVLLSYFLFRFIFRILLLFLPVFTYMFIYIHLYICLNVSLSICVILYLCFLYSFNYPRFYFFLCIYHRVSSSFSSFDSILSYSFRISTQSFLWLPSIKIIHYFFYVLFLNFLFFSQFSEIAPFLSSLYLFPRSFFPFLSPDTFRKEGEKPLTKERKMKENTEREDKKSKLG